MIFITGCATTQGQPITQNNQQQNYQPSSAVKTGLLGTGIGVIASIIKGGNSGQHALWGAVTGVGGYLIGNEKDKNNQKQQIQRLAGPSRSSSQSQSYNTSSNNNNRPEQTKFRKIVERRWNSKNKVWEETKIEKIESTKVVNSYYND